MPASIDLVPFFSTDSLHNAYANYLEAKRDKYTGKVHVLTGVDGVSLEEFEKRKDTELERISQRVLAGTYIFSPFIEYLKKDRLTQKERIISIATIGDTLVQKQIYRAVLRSAEKRFSSGSLDLVSLAYRPGKSIRDAAHGIRYSYQREGYTWVLDADIKKFFDNLNHQRLEQVVDEWVGLDTVTGKLIRRFVHVDRVPHDSYPNLEYFNQRKPKSKPERRKVGVPQGGVLSGLLANLYLHDFDRWVMHDLKRTHQLRYFRYADDFVILTNTEQDAHRIYERVFEQMGNLLLEMHPVEPKSKTQIVNIATDGLDFVGFNFRPNHVRIRSSNVCKFKRRLTEALAKEALWKGGKPANRAAILTRFGYVVSSVVNKKITGPEPPTCPICHLPTDRSRCWIGVFAPAVTDYHQLRTLDRWMRRRVAQYFLKTYRFRIKSKHFREAGMRSLVNEYYERRAEQPQICQCNRHHDQTTAPVTNSQPQPQP